MFIWYLGKCITLITKPAKNHHRSKQLTPRTTESLRQSERTKSSRSYILCKGEILQHAHRVGYVSMFWMKKVLQNFYCRKPSNHRMAWVRKDFKDHLAPCPCYGQGCIVFFFLYADVKRGSFSFNNTCFQIDKLMSLKQAAKCNILILKEQPTSMESGLFQVL